MNIEMIKKAKEVILTEEFRKEARECFKESLCYSSSQYNQVLLMNESGELEHLTIYGNFSTGENVLCLMDLKSLNLNDCDGWDERTIEKEDITPEQAYEEYTDEYFQDWFFALIENLEEELHRMVLLELMK